MAPDGDVFVSDFQEGAPAVYRIHRGGIHHWLTTDDLEGERPNGLWVKGETLYVGTASGKMLAVDIPSRHVNAADIWYDIPGKKLYVPGFFANKVLCYGVK